MKLKTRRKITITIILLILLFIIAYCFNIFNFRFIIKGENIIKSVDNGITTTKINGNNLKLPDEFVQSNIKIIDNDKIISYTKSENLENTTTPSSIIIQSSKTSDEIFDFYKEIYNSDNTLVVEDLDKKTIITGNATNVIKIIIENNEYTISIEKR